jgi:hypothetical protein
MTSPESEMLAFLGHWRLGEARIRHPRYSYNSPHAPYANNATVLYIPSTHPLIRPINSIQFPRCQDLPHD